MQRDLRSERTACLISTEPVTLSNVKVATMIALKSSCEENVLILNALHIRNKGHDYAVHAIFRTRHARLWCMGKGMEIGPAWLE